jgi:Fungal trichothecene efflux pump (TRI12)
MVCIPVIFATAAENWLGRSFLGQGPLIGVSGLLALWLIPRTQRRAEEGTKLEKFRRIDFAGAILLATTVTSFLVAIELGGQKVSWNSPVIFGLLAAGIVGAGWFFATEKYWAQEPIFPLELLWHRDVMCGYGLLILQIAAQLSVDCASSRLLKKLTFVVDVLRTCLFPGDRECLV